MILFCFRHSKQGPLKCRKWSLVFLECKGKPKTTKEGDTNYILLKLTMDKCYTYLTGTSIHLKYTCTTLNQLDVIGDTILCQMWLAYGLAFINLQWYSLSISISDYISTQFWRLFWRSCFMQDGGAVLILILRNFSLFTLLLYPVTGIFISWSLFRVTWQRHKLFKRRWTVPRAVISCLSGNRAD